MLNICQVNFGKLIITHKKDRILNAALSNAIIKQKK